MQRTRDDGRVVSAGLLEDGVVVGVFNNGHNEGVIGLDVSEALELARTILATYCQNCHQRGEVNDAGECADCSRNRLGREGGE